MKQVLQVALNTVFGDDPEYYKPASIKSTTVPSGEMIYEKGTLWHYIRQIPSGQVARQMYYGNNYVESDLVNSYMWDTSILYIQAMGHENYANYLGEKTDLMNAGESSDEVCKIFDMAGNLREWTTENSSNKIAGLPSPAVSRGNYRGSNSLRSSSYRSNDFLDRDMSTISRSIWFSRRSVLKTSFIDRMYITIKYYTKANYLQKIARIPCYFFMSIVK